MNEVNNGSLVKRIGGSPGNALSNNFKLDSNQVLQEAWELTKTTKPPFLLGAIIVYLVAIAGSVILEPLQVDLATIEETGVIPFGMLVSQLALQVVVAVLLAGLISMGLRNAVRHVKSSEGETTLVPENSPKMVFSHFTGAWPIAAIEVVKMVGIIALITLGIMLANPLGLEVNTLFGIFMLISLTFAVGLSLAVPLVIKDQLGPIKAIRISLTVVFRRFFTFLSIYAVFTILFMLSIFTLGIGLIWVIPLFYNVKGILYREIFGIETYVVAKTNTEYL